MTVQPHHTKPLRAGAYVRVSTTDQAERDSLIEQRRDIESYCQVRGYELIRWYEDPGFKGWSRHRPGFREMLDDIQNNAVDVVVVWHSDRLFRDFKPFVLVYEALEASGNRVTLESVKDFISMDSLPYQAIQAKAFIKRLSLNSRMGKKAKARRGILSGTPAYGYRLEGDSGDKKPVIDETQADTVRRVFSDYLNGLGTRQISRHLNEEGIPTRSGAPWRQNVVWRMLINPVYVGKGSFGKTSYYYQDGEHRDIRHKRVNPDDDIVSVEYPAIIEQSTFDMAQKIMAHPTRQREPVKYANVVYLLKGLLVCGDCGNFYTTSTTTRKSRKGVPYPSPRRRYQCQNGVANSFGCSRLYISAHTFEAEIWGFVAGVLKSPKAVDRLIQERRESITQSDTPQGIERAKTSLQSAENEIPRIQTMYQKGYLNESELDIRMRGVNERIEYHRAEMERLEAENSSLTGELDTLESFKTASATIAGRLDAMTDIEKRELLHLIVDRITIVGDRDTAPEITFRLDVAGVLSTEARRQHKPKHPYPTITLSVAL